MLSVQEALYNYRGFPVNLQDPRIRIFESLVDLKMRTAVLWIFHKVFLYHQMRGEENYIFTEVPITNFNPLPQGVQGPQIPATFAPPNKTEVATSAAVEAYCKMGKSILHAIKCIGVYIISLNVTTNFICMIKWKFDKYGANI